MAVRNLRDIVQHLQQEVPPIGTGGHGKPVEVVQHGQTVGFRDRFVERAGGEVFQDDPDHAVRLAVFVASGGLR
ncbi:hypothetical protein CLM85_18635 [Streptomyces albidoflavus]|nr:hypothetical protein CLM81_00700 [Streptomyces albidoflavus]PAX92463.1 hypothetical protein CLM82_03170 [Streptomyces albidoflavus]PBO20090.1 hypothetical protein CLM83_02520 [Streptomyces albidoflavus]PBO22987.1 hypothetical protein CLM85_18635 [Streptomyces albidoflavus]